MKRADLIRQLIPGPKRPREPIGCQCPPSVVREEAIRAEDGRVIAYQCRECGKAISSACPFCGKLFDRPRRHMADCPQRPRPEVRR